VDVRRAGPKFEHSQAELFTESRVSTSSEALKLADMGDKLIENQPNRLWALSQPPKFILHYSCDDFSQTFPVFCRSSAFVDYCRCKMKTKKKGLGNEAKSSDLVCIIGLNFASTKNTKVGESCRKNGDELESLIM